MKDADDLNVDVFHGQLSPQLAQIYARIDSLPGGDNWVLTGKLQGPDCLYARTLPVSTSFEDLGRGPSLMARASLVDPCFWSPELPATYRVSLDLRHRGEPVKAWQRMFAMRSLGTSGRSFYWAAKRWVLRGLLENSVQRGELAEWRERSAALVGTTNKEQLCANASRQGVLLVATLNDKEEITDHLRWLAQWPAVGIAVISSRHTPCAEADGTRSVPASTCGLHPTHDLRYFAPNLVLAHHMSAGNVQVPPWAHAVMADSSEIESLTTKPGNSLPLIALRPMGNLLSLAAARDACDVLQRDLAGLGDFAGYVV